MYHEDQMIRVLKLKGIRVFSSVTNISFLIVEKNLNAQIYIILREAKLANHIIILELIKRLTSTGCRYT